MPKVIFWNIARSAAKEGTLPTDMLTEDLAGLGETYKPDLMVLCECLTGFVGNASLLPVGYAFTLPRNQQLYVGDTMLRYGLLRKNSVKCEAELLETATPEKRLLRPAIGVVIPGAAYLIGLHAASISSTNSVQLSQLTAANRAFVSSAKRPPDLLIGDFNINLNEPNAGARVSAELQKTELAEYAVRRTKTSTHRGGSKLDWALAHPGLTQLTLSAIQPSNRTPEEKSQDRYLKLEFENQKGSDHLPIMAQW